MNTKQVIVIRKDLNMRRGKQIAQGSHASMAFLTKGMECFQSNDGYEFATETIYIERAEEIEHWLQNSFRKICVYVNSEEELVAVHQKAIDSGLISHLIIDNGKTEFHNIPTATCLAVGPAWDYKFSGITDHLPLL